jgi:hypothetical protein
MKLGDILNVMASKDGDELFEKVVEILARFDIEVMDEEGNDKDLYTLCCEVAEVLNKRK